MNSGPQINDRLIALVNASPFRPFTVSLTLGRKWRIGSADQLELFPRGASGAHCYRNRAHPIVPSQIVRYYFEPEEVLAIHNDSAT
jgi:hypothetical protein